MALHPDPHKKGVNIGGAKYRTVREAIFSPMQQRETTGFTELVDDVKSRLTGQFDGSVTWYVTTVKLDLEARGLLERVPGSGRQRIRLVTELEEAET